METSHSWDIARSSIDLTMWLSGDLCSSNHVGESWIATEVWPIFILIYLLASSEHSSSPINALCDGKYTCIQMNNRSVSKLCMFLIETINLKLELTNPVMRYFRDGIITLKFESVQQPFVLKVAFHTHHYYHLSYIYLLN
jgi:hypothetical protein